MVIAKNGKEYTTEEREKYWAVSCKIEKLTVEYKVPKDICADEEALREYIETEDLF